MSNLKSRLILFAREKYNLGQNKFEEYCGITSGTINKIKEGSGISTNTLTKILLKCPELNARWLLLGVGDMLEGESKEISPCEKSPSVEVNNVHGNHNVFISNWGDLKDVIRQAIREEKI
jgi:transcriptional regulator with XRE-family HTH domain